MNKLGTTEISDNSIIIIRDKEEKLRAYANICRHRLSRLLKDKGNVKQTENHKYPSTN